MIEYRVAAAWYRNSYKEVRRFLESRTRSGGTYKVHPWAKMLLLQLGQCAACAVFHVCHMTGQVYNLTTERPQYEPEKLGGLLACYGFEDHQVPTLEQMHSFCEDVDEFLSLHQHNFAAVHCKVRMLFPAGLGQSCITVENGLGTDQSHACRRAKAGRA